MAAVRPVITVFDLEGNKVDQIKTPAVFSAAIRKDIIHHIHTNVSKNKRQPYAVKHMAGMGHSAESWGTGRAVARIPRVSGSGTGRSGQAAFGNMCRKGRMFAPTKIWRRWHRSSNLKQKRYAIAAAVAASAVPAFVLARGHAVGSVKELPLVVDNSIESITKTRQALAVLKAVGAEAEIIKCKKSRAATSGRARIRNRTHTVKRGPLVIYAKDDGIVRAFRNIPGVETSSVERLNILQLAPNATLGRFVIWTKGAIDALVAMYGTETTAPTKSGFFFHRAAMTVPSLHRILNAPEVKAKLRARRSTAAKVERVNPLSNIRALAKLNPYAIHLKRVQIQQQARATEANKARKEAIAAGKSYTITKKQATARAFKKANAPLSKLLKRAAKTDVQVTPEQLSAATFNPATFKKIAKIRTIQPAVRPSLKLNETQIAKLQGKSL